VNFETKDVIEIVIVVKPAFPSSGNSENLFLFLKTKKDGVICLKLLYDIQIDELMETISILEPKGINITTSYSDPLWAD